MVVQLLDDHVAHGGLPRGRPARNPDDEGLPEGGWGGDVGVGVGEPVGEGGGIRSLAGPADCSDRKSVV